MIAFEPLKSGRRDLNPRLPAWEASTLPLSYSRKFVVSAYLLVTSVDCSILTRVTFPSLGHIFRDNRGRSRDKTTTRFQCYSRTPGRSTIPRSLACDRSISKYLPTQCGVRQTVANLLVRITVS